MQKTPEEIQQEKLIGKLYRTLYFLVGFLVIIVVAGMIYVWVGNPFASLFSPRPVAEARQPKPVAGTDADEAIENGVHVMSGLQIGKGFEIVKANCTACHSGKLIAQNRASREGWEEMIRWMQRTQGLWDLGVNEPIILDYLAEHYAPQEIGRRANLEEVEWYILEEN